jgi:hypothetical protein
LIRPSPERPARTSSPGRPQTTCPNDPPERVHTGALKRPARTTHRNDPPERPTRTTRPNDPPERPARTSTHGRPQTTRPNDPPERPAQTTCPNEFTRAPSNDPPERPTRTTCPNEFTRVPSNDPPERTTETNRQGRAGQTSCTNVHKANLGSQLSIFDTALARTTRPNEFTRAPSNDPPERPTRTTRPNDPPERVHTGALKRPARTTRLNEFTRAPSNDPPERVHTGALKRPARTSSHGRPQTTRPNDPPVRVHTGALERPGRTTHQNEFTRAPSNDPPERPTRTTRPNEFTRAPSNDPPERVHTGALKRPARTSSHGRPQTTRPNDPPERPARTSSHGRPQTTRPNEFTRAPSNDPPDRVHTGALKRPARTSSHGPPQTTRPNDPPERPARTSSHGRPQTTRPNEFTRAPSNDPPKRFFMGARTTETNRQGRAGQTSGTNVHKANLGSQLSIFDTALARTTRLNEFTRAPSNDPPERVHTGALKRPARTTHPNDPPDRVHTVALKRPARTTHPNEFTRAPSNDPPERFFMAARTTETNRQGRVGQTSCTNVHKANLGSQLSIFHTGCFARAGPRPNEFTRVPSNDPPERFCMGARTTETNRQGRAGQTSCTNVHKANLGSQLSIFYTALARTSSHGHPQTTRPNEFTRAPSNYPPERFCMGARTTKTNRQGRAGKTTRPDESLHGKRARSNEFTWAPTHDQNEVTREIRANGRHDLCTRPTPLHNLALFIRPRVPWVPSHDTT